MRHTLTFLPFLLVSFSANALTVTVSATSDGTDKPTINGQTNLPDGTELMITLKRKESRYSAEDKAKVKGGAFRAGPFSTKGAGLNPGVYTVEVTSPLAQFQPPQTWPAIGKDGSSLAGPLVKKSEYGGNVVEYKTTVKVGAGVGSAEKDKASREQEAKDMHAWWLQSCKSNCNTTQNFARKHNGTINWDSCYAKCVADEPKRK